jgi:hypothetical protein
MPANFRSASTPSGHRVSRRHICPARKAALQKLGGINVAHQNTFAHGHEKEEMKI